MLEMRGVTKSYAPDAGDVLRGVDLQLRRGDTAAIVGPSGCGKTTLLSIAGTLDRPTSGVVLLEGHDPAPLGEDDLARLRNARIGFVFQLHHLLPQCTVLENVLVPTLVSAAGPSPEIVENARRLLDRVGLGARLDAVPGRLSGGERQRVAVVRALVNRPALVLADEPTGALDRRNAEGLCDLLSEINAEEGVTILMVTHAVALARRMRRVLSLRDGRLQEGGEA
jgi:lipoprotein-releasing system ATP-binding protein